MTYIGPGSQPNNPKVRQALNSPVMGQVVRRTTPAAPPKSIRKAERSVQNTPAIASNAALADRRAGSQAVPVTQTSTDFGGGGGGGGGGFGGDFGDVPPATPMMSDEEYLKADSIFQAQKNALQAALDAYLADMDAQQATYATNYGDSLRKLGFTGDQGALDTAKFDPDDNRWEDKEGNPFSGKISWNQTDTTTASGRGFENALNDFASRGMLQSSAYQRAYNNLQRQLNEQLASTAGAKQTAFGEFERGRSSKRQEKTTAEATASQEALARIKAAYGIG